MRKRPSIAWSTAVMVRPVVPTVPLPISPNPLDGAPDLQVELTPPPKLMTPRVFVPRPRVNPQTIPSPDKSGGDILLLAPQLSAEETITAQRETNQDITQAENNLASTRGRSLNAVQSDLASKVLGFLADAKDASRAGDWDRARSLAKKAQFLSQVLVSSF